MNFWCFLVTPDKRELKDIFGISWGYLGAGVTKKHQKFIFEYWLFPQKSYLNMWCFEKNQHLHTKNWRRVLGMQIWIL